MTDRRPTIVFLHGSRLTSVAWTAQVAAARERVPLPRAGPGRPREGRGRAVHGRRGGGPDRRAHRATRPTTAGRSSSGCRWADTSRWPSPRGTPSGSAASSLTGATAEPVGPRAIFFLAYWAVFRYAPPRLDRAASAWYFRRRFPPPLAEPIVAAGCSFPDRAAALRSLVGQRFKPRLAAYPGPSLIVNGEYDLFFRPAERSFADVAADPRRVVIRRASHLVNLEQPEAFTAVVRRFARSLPPVGETAAGR